METITETKAQRAERLKREKNPWECLDEIRRFARDGYDAIPPEWLGTYFRWWGVYTQGDGAGASAVRAARAGRCRTSWRVFGSPMACFSRTSFVPSPTWRNGTPAEWPM